MGSALVKGWLQNPAIAHIDIIEPHAMPTFEDLHVRMFADAQSWAATTTLPDIVVLAVKPQMVAAASDSLCKMIPMHIPILSIAAGITLTNLTNLWGAERPAIRAMPNTPGAIGQGVTVYCKNENIIIKHEDIAFSLLSSLGTVYQVTDEKLIDAVTALSGSGPAYLFHFVEALESAGKSIGLPDDLAKHLARQTVIGSAALLAHENSSSPADLRQAVTSPNGTTEAGLGVLMGNHGLTSLMIETLETACRRSRELKIS